MISFHSNLRVLVSTQPIDFSKGVHGLVALVAEGMKSDPYCGDVFVFRSKRKDRLKILVFDGAGIGPRDEMAGVRVLRLAGPRV
jgi:transposase